ncbi:Sec-independent protein translocase subunit TatA/TatB [Hymenobacter rubidus]|uniref:Sec-independent protein translocase subunit TatA/TatB n=1 Tax=Hymenobacter rubidus TaxID=1441626 RepID=UPI00293D62B1|nr:twin-arginine translocase TatA/TatE family subunit [Hymenobacter rubidus]
MLHSLFLIGSFGTTEILLILFVIILLFGAKRIPELFRGMGQGVREFKDATAKPEDQQPQYRDQPAPPYQQQYPPQGYPQPGYPQQPPQPGYPQQGGYPPQQGYPQGAPQPGYQQPAPPVFNPNDPNNQPRQ